MRLRDIAGITIYPDVIDNDGKNIKNTLDDIYSQLDRIRTRISSFNSQATQINTIKSHIASINDDIEYLGTWESGDANNITIVNDQSTNRPLINIIGGGYWTRSAVTYINIIIQCNFNWSSSQRICLGFPLPTNNVALSTFGPYFRTAMIDTSGYLMIGPETTNLESSYMDSNNPIYYIAGSYANKHS